MEDKDTKGLTGRSQGFNTIDIPGELESRTRRGVTVAAGTVYDYGWDNGNEESQGAFQEHINRTLKTRIESIDNTIDEVINPAVSKIPTLEDKIDNNIPCIVLYEKQYIIIPCDAYGNYVGDEDYIQTVVRLYHGNIIELLNEQDGITPITQITGIEVIESSNREYATIAITRANINNLEDLTEFNFRLKGASGSLVNGKVIFNKVKRGKSAYEVWKDEGNEGDVEVFLASLKESGFETKPVQTKPDATDFANHDISSHTIYAIPDENGDNDSETWSEWIYNGITLDDEGGEEATYNVGNWLLLAKHNGSGLSSVIRDIASVNSKVNEFEEVKDIVITSGPRDVSADLSGVVNAGYIKWSDLEVHEPTSTSWVYGMIHIPMYASAVTFNTLPSAQFSGAVGAYFVDDDGEPLGDVLHGDAYLGAGIVEIDIPNGAVGIMFTGRTSDIDDYSIKFSVNSESLINQTANALQKAEQAKSMVDNISDELYNSEQRNVEADLSQVNTLGFYRKSDGQYTSSNTKWICGLIPIPTGAETITFNALLSNTPDSTVAPYTNAVVSYFVNADGNVIGLLNTGDGYITNAIVVWDIPSGATGLRFTGIAAGINDYDIKFKVNKVSIKNQIAENTRRIEELEEVIGSNENFEIDVLIPNTVYAVVGTELNIWNDAVSLSVDGGLQSPKNYVVEWHCNKGFVTSRCFRFTPETRDVGEHSCKCSIYTTDRHTLIAEKTFTIKVAGKDGITSNKNIIHFGDSLGRDLAEKMYDNFSSNEKFTGIIPSMLGTKGSIKHYEAVGGWTWKAYATEGFIGYRISVSGVTDIRMGDVYTDGTYDFEVYEVNVSQGSGNCLLGKYYTRNGALTMPSGTLTIVSGNGDSIVTYSDAYQESVNPLWNDTELDIQQYKQKLVNINQLSSVSDKIDAVSFQFGVNESLSGNPVLTTILNDYIIPLYNLFVGDNPSCKFIIGLTTSANNSRGNSDAARNIWQYLKSTYNFRKMYLDELQGNELYPNIIIASTHLQIDRYFGYQIGTRQVSARTSASEQYHKNFVHPSTDGYGQLADALFATYVNVLSDE